MALPILRLNAKLEGELEYGRRRFSVPFALPGDLVQFRLGHRRKKKLQVLHIERAASYAKGLRLAEPFCKYFGTCGGCRGQHLEYSYQLDLKCGPIEKAMRERFGLAVKRIPAPERQGHRHRMDFVVDRDDKGVPIVGQRPAGDYSRFVDIESCPVQNPLANELLLLVRRLLVRYPDAAFQRSRQGGVLKYVTIRSSHDSETENSETETQHPQSKNLQEKYPQEKYFQRKQNALLILTIARGRKDDVSYQKFCKELSRFLESPSTQPGELPLLGKSRIGLVECEADLLAENSAVPGGKTLLGEPFYEESLGGQKFAVPYDGFFQPNPKAFGQLLDFCFEALAAELPLRPVSAAASPGTLLDLYCGAGVLSRIFVSKFQDIFSEVLGLDFTQSAIASAKFAPFASGLQKDFRAVDLNQFEDAIKEEIKHKKLSLAIADPPRAGLSKAVRKFLTRDLKPPLFLYISCNPATQIQDLEEFKENYEFAAGALADCYPQTGHLEQAVLLRRKPGLRP